MLYMYQEIRLDKLIAITIDVITNENRFLKEAILYLWLENIYDRINGLSIQDRRVLILFGMDNVIMLLS